MLAKGVICLTNSSSAISVTLRKFKVERCILIIKRSKGTCITSVIPYNSNSFISITIIVISIK
jgi:hypothetical protein